MEIKHWKISDFAKILDKHNNTIDGWFRELENKRKLHYISRVNGEKIYDELDLSIAKFIIERREQKWSLNAIFDDLPNNFNLRPFPENFEVENKELQVVDVDKIRATIINEMKMVFEDSVEKQVEEQMRGIQKLLPSKEEERLARLDAIIAERKVTRILEDKAISLWNEKPEEERLIKVGWFRKEEDRDKRDLFVKNYVDAHFEEYIKKEFDI